MKIAENVISAVALLLLSGVSLLAAPSKSGGVNLRLDPAATLPGLPVAFLVTLPVEVVELGMNEVGAVLHVTPPSGETFQAYFDYDAAQDSVDHQTTVQGSINLHLQSLPSHGMIEIQQAIDPPWGPAWFADHRLHKPGSYRLRLQILATELDMPEDLWSSEATLEVRKPEGADAEAWAWLLANGWKREKWSEDYGRHLVEKFPTTEYARYGVGMLARQHGDAAIPWMQKAIELSEGTWLADYYRIWQQGKRAADSSCGEAASRGASRGEVRRCVLQVTLDVNEKIRSIASRTSSPSVRHIAESSQRRLKQQADDLNAVKE